LAASIPTPAGDGRAADPLTTEKELSYWPDTKIASLSPVATAEILSSPELPLTIAQSRLPVELYLARIKSCPPTAVKERAPIDKEPETKPPRITLLAESTAREVIWSLPELPKALYHKRFPKESSLSSKASEPPTGLIVLELMVMVSEK